MNVASTAAYPVPKVDKVVTNFTPAITTATVASTLKELKTTPVAKSKVAVPSISTGTIGKTTGKTGGPAEIPG